MSRCYLMLGLLLGTEAPVMTLNGVDFSFLFLSFLFFLFYFMHDDGGARGASACLNMGGLSGRGMPA